MNSANSRLFRPLFFLFLMIAVFSEAFLHALGQQIDRESEGTQNGFGRRVLMSFKEKPAGSNVTFECSPSGPCVPCLYSEKGDEKYRCSETGYRIPLKCIENENSVKSSKKTDSQNARSTLEVSNSIAESHKVLHDASELFTTALEQRSLLDGSSTSDSRPQAYITYRSCIPATTEEKLSVLSFERSVSGVKCLKKQNRMMFEGAKLSANLNVYCPERPPLNFTSLCRFFLLALFGCSATVLAYVGIDLSSPTLVTAFLNFIPAFTFVLVLPFSVVATVIRYSLCTWCMQKAGPLFCTIFKPVGIIFTVTMGALFLGDDFHLGCLVGAVIIVVEFYVVMWGKAKEEKKVEGGFENLESSCHNAPLLQNKI